MAKIKFEFSNANGQTLAGLLETPDNVSDVKQSAIFAHCFTCGKDIAAASRIARALAQRGIAVLRFDFTGLGNSDGDFANTNFSSNVDDLIAAANALKERYEAPSLIIGHSLGGAANYWPQSWWRGGVTSGQAHTITQGRCHDCSTSNRSACEALIL